MSLTPDQVERIKGRLPGWEEDWGQLCVLLLGDDGHSGVLGRAVRSLPVDWPSENERDDFISEVRAGYQRRAVGGGLLKAYKPDRGDVVHFLTPRRILYERAVKFLARLAKRQLCSVDDPEFGATTEPQAKPDLDYAVRGFTTLITRVQEQLHRINLKPTNRVTRIVEQAGLQLYPRLDWSQSTMTPLLEHLQRVIRTPSDGADAIAALTSAHDDADRVFRRRLERLSARIHNKGTGVSVKRRELLEDRFADLCFQRVFLPLSAAALVDLLGITRADAAQRRHRYREELPRLLPGLQACYHDLEDCRQEISREQSK